VELLKEVIPSISHVAALWNPGNEPSALRFKDMQTAAQILKLTLQSVEVRTPVDFDWAFATIKRGRARALIVDLDPVNISQKQRIVEFALNNRLPAFYGVREFVESGGLMSYSPDWLDIYRRAGRYLGKIMAGVKPADLPIEQPTKFELVVNMRTAKALGLTIPPSILVRADQVID
jgi:putative tryptophan/tyrosine transport system substrate-binding protein